MSLTKRQTHVSSDSQNRHHSNTNKKTSTKNTTNTTKAAGAAGGSGVIFDDQEAQPPGPPKTGRIDKSKPVNLGEAFLTRWKETYKLWYGVGYIQKSGEAEKAREVIEDLQCRPKDLLTYAFRMWINMEDFVDVCKGHDPLFYQIKGSCSLSFFLKYIQDIAVEQKEPLDGSITVDDKEFRELEAKISEGMPKC